MAPAVEVWPECETAVLLFNSLSTQWRTGMGGPTGLDYNPLLLLMARMDLSNTEHQHLFADIQTLEAAALAAIQEAKT